MTLMTTTQALPAAETFGGPALGSATPDISPFAAAAFPAPACPVRLSAADASMLVRCDAAAWAGAPAPAPRVRKRAAVRTGAGAPQATPVAGALAQQAVGVTAVPFPSFLHPSVDIRSVLAQVPPG